MINSNNQLGLAYVRVADTLRQQIMGGEFKPGEQLPKQHDLAKQLKVSLNTLTNALNILERESLVVRKAGQGTYASLPEHRSPSALVVDDEENIRNLFSAYLAGHGWKCVGVPTGQEAVKAIKGRKFDIVFLDLVMPKMNGAQTLRKLREVDPTSNVVVITAYPDTAIMWEALQVGPFAVVRKPVVLDELRMLLDRTADAADPQSQNHRPSAREPSLHTEASL